MIDCPDCSGLGVQDNGGCGDPECCSPWYCDLCEGTGEIEDTEE